MSNLNLSKIAFLTDGALRYALELDLGISSKEELMKYLNEYYRENNNLFVPRKKKVKGKEIDVVEFVVKFRNGKVLTAIFEKNTNINRPSLQIWALTKFVNKIKEEKHIYEFAEFYGFNHSKYKEGDKKLKELVDLALEEDWGKQNLGLVRYVENTFHFLKENESHKIVETEDKEYAVFNTGLVSKTWEPIYALFEKNRSRKKPYYRLANFCTQKNTDGKILNDKFEKLPDRANYFTRENASEILIFDHTKELIPDLEHIIFDGLKRNRFPEEIIEKYGIKKEDIRKGTNTNAITNLQMNLERAINNAKLRVSQNYKIALPMYYPKLNKMSFLLPIVLGEDVEGKADLALVVSLTENKIRYQGQTVLKLSMAYSNSRLICKPSNEWLEIDANSEIEDE